jgi:hypothetical protein
VAEPSRPAAKELSSWFFQHLREAWCLLKNSYLTFDRRTLGLTRILLGWFLICDLFRRAAAWPDMLSDVGVLPNWVILEKPQSNNFSLLHGFTTAPELWVLWVVILATYVALLVGYKTKLAQVLSLMFITSMNGRVLLIENGGYVVQSLVLLWTCFMPLGDRFSVDAMLASMRRRRERTAEDLNDRRDVIEGFRLTPFVSIVGIAVCLQIAAIYYFNVVHKFGPGWKRDFNATHYVMYVDRMITPIVAHVRDHIPFRVHQVMTAGVIASEAGIAFCMLLPQLVVFGFDVKLWLRRIAIVLINVLHIGFGSTFVLGPFAWALCVFATVLFSYEDWETTIHAMRREHRRRRVVFDKASGATLWLCRVLARLDRFGLLEFEEATTAEARASRISVIRPGSELPITGHAALAEIVAALPVGPAFAWLLRVPPFSLLADAALGWAKGRATRLLGLGDVDPEVESDVRPRRILRGVGRLASELACAVMLLACLNQAIVELWSTQRRYKEWIAALNKKHGWKLEPQSDMMRTLTHKARFLQGWFMFSPNPVTVDGIVVVDAVTVDGRHIDPLNYGPPNFDLLHAQSFGYNQIWSDYANRIQGDGARAYQKPLVDYMRRLPERTGNPSDALVSGEVYWVTDHNPRPRTKNSYGQVETLLFSFGQSGPPTYDKPTKPKPK